MGEKTEKKLALCFSWWTGAFLGQMDEWNEKASLEWGLTTMKYDITAR